MQQQTSPPRHAHHPLPPPGDTAVCTPAHCTAPLRSGSSFGVVACSCRFPFQLSFATEDAREKAQLKRIIVSKFSSLSDVFRYFSGLSTVTGQADTVMQYAEFRYVCVCP
jgi:hypothetical protein